MDRVIYCRDGRRERQCLNSIGGRTCALPAGHDGVCAPCRSADCNADDRFDARRLAEASKEPKPGALRVWANRERN